MAIQPTRAQQEAITALDRNVVVLASAGTGKTSVLVRRFLHILEHRPAWPMHSILAITFTRLAARQMRTRILQGVARKRKEQPESALWRQRAEELDQVQVSTVHSLCERILRGHALEADLDPDFQIADENEAQVLQAQALDALWQELDRAQPPWMEALHPYTLRDIQQTVQSLFGKRSTLHAVLQETDTQPEGLLGAWNALIQEEQDHAWERYWSAHPELGDAIAWLKRARGFPGDEDKWGQKMEPARRAAQALEDKEWSLAVRQVGDGGLGSMRGGRAANWGGQEALASAQAHVKAINAACKFVQKQEFQTQPTSDDMRAARTMQAWLQVWDRAQAHYERVKRKHQRLDYDDLEIRTQALLEQATADPESRIGQYVKNIRHVLADEHQDINPIQQRIINALAPLHEPGKLFVVGDTKQSIYRFRQAQVTAFADLATRLRRMTKVSETELTDSFRTHSQLTAATNHLFAYVFQPLQGSEPVRYEAKPLALKSSRRSPLSMPSLELHLVRPSEDAPMPDARDMRQDEARAVAARILQLVEDEVEIRDLHSQKLRPFRWSDAAVLLRSLGDRHLYESEFRQANVPYRLVSGSPLQSQPHIRNIVALLKHLHNPQDDFNLAAALRSPLFGLSDETLYRLVAGTRAADMPLHRFASLSENNTDQTALVREAGDILARLQTQAYTVLPDRLLQQVLDETGYLASCMADTDDYRRDRYLDDIYAFQSHIRQQATQGLGEAIHMFETLEARYEREEEESVSGQNALVQIMSVHAAKGLEFPVVFVPQLDRRLLGGGDWRNVSLLDFDPEYGIVCQLRDDRGLLFKPSSYRAAMRRDQRIEYAETKRILYVACTRAADLLVLSAKKGSLRTAADTGFASNWLTAVMEAFGLSYEDFGQYNQRSARGNVRIACYGHEAGCVEMPPSSRISKPKESERLDNMPLMSFVPEEEEDNMREWSEDSLGQQIGRFTHDILALWDAWIEKADSDLKDYVYFKARQHKISDADAVDKIAALLLALRRMPEALAISEAFEKHWEMPITQRHGDRTIHRRIDLAYKTGAGNWHIVDWKTEAVTTESLMEAKSQYFRVLSEYANALKALVGQFPKVSLCFLFPEIRFLRITRDELAQASSLSSACNQ